MFARVLQSGLFCDIGDSASISRREKITIGRKRNSGDGGGNDGKNGGATMRSNAIIAKNIRGLTPNGMNPLRYC